MNRTHRVWASLVLLACLLARTAAADDAGAEPAPHDAGAAHDAGAEHDAGAAPKKAHKPRGDAGVEKEKPHAKDGEPRDDTVGMQKDDPELHDGRDVEARKVVHEEEKEAAEGKEDAPKPENISPAPPVELPEFVEEHLPKKVVDVVQGAVNQMAESRAPPNKLLYGIFGLPRSRFGTGTAWLPDASPLYAAIPHIGKWGLLLNGNVYTGYNWYSSKRGGQRFMGRNTLVGAAFRTFQKSEVVFRLAMSFEPITIGSQGYPQILQTGQTANGTRITDHMYALDFFREMAAMYTWEVTKKWAGTVYAALAGEPALGPVTFTQRISASADPLAPLGFQQQEASHASFGVLTVGAHTRKFKIEASWFNGEVPGKHRYTLALRKPDSYAVRLNWNPGSHWSGQVSYGFLERPVPSDPRHQHRVSASMTYTAWSARDAGFAATLSAAERIDTNLNSGTALMLECYWNIDGNNAVFSRFEILQKSSKELVLPTMSDELYAVGSLAGGYIYYFGPFLTLQPGLGVRASINPMESDLARYYGSQVAYGVMGFAQLRTSALPIPSRQ